jgi:hypothetical protein
LENTVICGTPATGLTEHHHHIHVSERATGGIIKVAIHGRAPTLMQTRRVDINNLCVITLVNTQNPMPSGLRFTRGDADFLPQQRI